MFERKPKVLVIDDSALVARATSSALEQSGFDGRAARTLGEFNALLTAWSPTIVLADVNMPGALGTELCTWIKQRVSTMETLVVLFSDASDHSLSALARRCGADAYVSKSHGIAHVARELSKLCEEIVW